MACAIAREVRDGETVAVGTLAAIPACGALLAHFTHAPRATVLIFNHPDYWPFRGGSKEFYDFAQRGKLDLFFLSGGQIDRHGNLNLMFVGDQARPDVRFPGGAGAAMLYYLPRRVVVFRGHHSPRIFVERVDTVTSPGTTPPDVVRPGGPSKVVTPLCVFRLDRGSAVLVVESLHPGVSREELERQTGFALAYDRAVGVTPEPAREELVLLRTRVKEAVARTYPLFATTAFGS